MSLDIASESVCYVHCNFCNTILAVSVPCSSMLTIVTVRCGHCANLLSVNMGALLQTLPLQDLQWAMPNSVEGLMQWWSFCKMKKTEKLLWKVVPLAVLWSIWKHRNECVFNGAQPNLEELCEVVKVRIALWAQSSPAKMKFSINDVVFNLPQVQYCIRNG